MYSEYKLVHQCRASNAGRVSAERTLKTTSEILVPILSNPAGNFL